MKSKTERLENDMESNILEFECVGLNDGGKFPIENTGRGQDISPEFIIRNLNTNAVTLMITLEDLSHPIKGFTQDCVELSAKNGRLISNRETNINTLTATRFDAKHLSNSSLQAPHSMYV